MTTQTSLVTGVDFVSVPTQDLEAATEFYGTGYMAFFTDPDGSGPLPPECDPLKAGRYLCDEIGGRLTSSVGFSTLYDDTDGIRPTRGQRFILSADFAGLGGDIKYVRTTVNGTMASSSDTDYFVVQVPAGKTLSAVMTPNSSSDYDLYIYNSSGTQLATSQNGTGAVDSASSANTGSTTAARYVRVVYYSGGTGSTSGKYTLKLSW